MFVIALNCYNNVKAAMDNTERDGCGCVPITLVIKEGWIRPVGQSFTKRYSRESEDPRCQLVAQSVQRKSNAREESKDLLFLWHFGSICCHPMVFHSPV